jgi:hypothetical protein
MVKKIDNWSRGNRARDVRFIDKYIEQNKITNLPSPIASEPFMILSLRQESANILQF